MINRFSEFLVEEERIGYLVFGRMNPPTIGHGKLLDKLAASAGRAPRCPTIRAHCSSRSYSHSHSSTVRPQRRRVRRVAARRRLTSQRRDHRRRRHPRVYSVHWAVLEQVVEAAPAAPCHRFERRSRPHRRHRPLAQGQRQGRCLARRSGRSATIMTICPRC